MKWIIDRREGDFWIVETEAGNSGKISLSLLPDAKEGDVFFIEHSESDTEKRKSDFQNRLNRLFEKE